MPIIMTASAVVLATFLAAGSSPSLESARASIKGLQFAQALKDLKALEQKSDLSREQAVELYEMKGVAAASLNDGAEAQKAFEMMLAIDQAATLKGRYSPRVMTPFFEARSLVKEQGPMVINVTPTFAGAQVKSLEFTRSGLRSELMARLSVQVRESANGGWRRVDTTWQGGKASVPVQGKSVDVTVRGLNEQDWELYASGDIKHFEAPRAAAVATVEPAEVPPTPPPAVVAASGGAEPKYRPAAIGLFAAGAVGVGVGVALLGSAAGLRAKFDSATTEGGVVTSLTRTEALALQKDAQTQNTLGAVVTSVGVAAAVAGGVVWLLGTPEAPQVAVIPTHDGAFVSVGGRF